jgi:hypothetical protein
MQRRRWIDKWVGLALAAAPVVLAAQFTSPNVIAIPGDVASTLGGTVFINRGLVGVGRISASQIDPLGESFGSVSGLQVVQWVRNPDGSYAGTLMILPDRGYNSGNFFADYASRIEQVPFTFAPYSGASTLPGSTVAEKVAAQSQIVAGPTITATRFTYSDPTRGTSFTTGLDPGAASAVLFGKTVPYVRTYIGQRTPDDPQTTTFVDVNKLPIDAEALALRGDGSGYIGDEYGANVYHFDAAKRIDGLIVPPPATQPHLPAGTAYFSGSVLNGGSVNPANGRRPNQGLEGVALSPDGTRLFALLQSATMQDSSIADNQTRRHTRLLVYDVSSNPTPDAPFREFVLTLPTLRSNGNGGGPATLNATAQQSEIVALDNTRFLVLPRDGNGLGTTTTNQSVYKTVLLVDTGAGSPTEFSADVAANAEGGTIATVSAGVSTLLPGITALAWTEAINILNTAQLQKFHIALDTGGAVTKLTLGEKWEGLALVPALDPSAPDDYFLFVGNDNDFLTSSGLMRGPDGTIVGYNGFSQHPAARIPPAVGSPTNDSDTLILAYRVTITAAPTMVQGGFVLDRRTQRFVQQLTVRNGFATPLVGPIYVALDALSGNATVVGAAGVTTKNAPLGSPVIQVVPPGGALAPGGSITVALQFTNPSLARITYTPRVLVLTGPGTP